MPETSSTCRQTVEEFVRRVLNEISQSVYPKDLKTPEDRDTVSITLSDVVKEMKSEFQNTLLLNFIMEVLGDEQVGVYIFFFISF